MSFSWANKLAKNALLSAQKHIDSVLDIQNEEETPECSTETEDCETYDESQSKQESEEYSVTSESDAAPYADIELSVNTAHTSDWTTEQKNTPVVDSEPNPIRDAHEDAITPLNYSPTSNTNTPEEESIDGAHEEIQHDRHTGSSIDLSLINSNSQRSTSPRSVRSEEPRRVVDALSEDMHTIASSDIEVVKQLDDWSVSSGNQWRHVNDVNVITASILPDNDLLHSSMVDSIRLLSAGPSTQIVDAPLTSQIVDHTSYGGNEEISQSRSEAKKASAKGRESGNSTSSAADDGLHERVAVLEAKLRHKEQQMEEVLKQNEKLRTSNINLAAKNKQMSNRSSVEAKLQKQLAEKEKELSDLMEEGKRLSEHSGKQAKEIRKLKQQNSQLNAVEAARDSALSELQAAHRTIQEHAREIEELRESLKNAEAMSNQLKTESELNRASTDIVEKFMNEKNAEVETMAKDLQRTKDELKSALRTKTQLSDELQAVKLKLLNKRAHDSAESDRERGEYEDLVAEKARNAALIAQIRQLELKNEMLMNTQHDIASQISEANLPLLNSISSLEEKVCLLERQNDVLTSQLNLANENGERQKRDTDSQLRIVAQRLDEAHKLVTSKDADLSRYVSENKSLKSTIEKIEEELRTLRIESARKYRETEERNAQLVSELNAKQASYENLERQYADLLKSSMSFAANDETANARRHSPQRHLPTSTKLEDVQEEEDSEIIENDETKVPLKEEWKEMTSSMAREKDSDSSEPVDEMNVVMNWQKSTTSQIGSLISETKSKTSLVRPNAQSDSALQSVSVEFLRNELEDAHAQLYQLREKFDRLLELYGGCLENIDELKYDNEDLRKLCKEQAVELSNLKSR